MVNIFGTVVGVTAFLHSRKDPNTATIDDFAFRLHYEVTAGFFFLATSLLSLNDLFGKAIQCQTYENGKITASKQAVTQFCFVEGTYTFPCQNGTAHPDTPWLCKGSKTNEFCFKKKKEEKEGKISEVREFYKLDDERNIYLISEKRTELIKDLTKKANDNFIHECKKSHSYYQWIQFVFVFLGFLFLVPHQIWRNLEQGKMSAISTGVGKANQEMNENKRKNMINNIARYVKKEDSGASHRWYAYSYLGCACLNLAMVVASIYLLDAFISGEFADLGWRYIDPGNDRNQNQLLQDIFPKMTICQWKTYGSGGGEEIQNHLCLLATNILTEKTFVFLWSVSGEIFASFAGLKLKH